MKVTQVYSIINAVNQQMQGESAVAVVDLRGLVQLGDSVLSSNDSKDKFLNTLVDRIGKTIISQRAYSADVLSLMNDAFEFGAILQKIYVEPIAATESKQWNLTDGVGVDQYVIAKPTVHQKLFSDMVSWELTVTIPDVQLKSAFTDAAQMAAFIDAIFLSMRNSMEMKLESLVEMTYCNFIGERCVNTKINSGHTVINLLTDYNTLFTKELTPALAMADTEFLKFASMTINMYLKRMGKMSTLFNSASYKRFTTAENARVTMLMDFTSAVTTYLQSNTYHDELVALPNYNEIPYWQGSGTAYGFANTSKIVITTSDGYNVTQDGIVCLISDVEALGLTVDNRRSKSAYNSRGEYTNFFEKADMGYFNDLSENGIVFVIAESIATPVLHA